MRPLPHTVPQSLSLVQAAPWFEVLGAQKASPPPTSLFPLPLPFPTKAKKPKPWCPVLFDASAGEPSDTNDTILPSGETSRSPMLARKQLPVVPQSVDEVQFFEESSEHQPVWLVTWLSVFFLVSKANSSSPTSLFPPVGLPLKMRKTRFPRESAAHALSRGARQEPPGQSFEVRHACPTFAPSEHRSGSLLVMFCKPPAAVPRKAFSAVPDPLLISTQRTSPLLMNPLVETARMNWGRHMLLYPYPCKGVSLARLAFDRPGARACPAALAFSS